MMDAAVFLRLIAAQAALQALFSSSHGITYLVHDMVER